MLLRPVWLAGARPERYFVRVPLELQNRDVSEGAERLAQIRRDMIAESPLADMAEWPITGAPPRAEILRGYGLTTESTTPERYAELRIIRFPITRSFSFAIPCAEAIDTLAGLSPLVEIGAGSGYWSAILKARGADVIASDVQHEGDVGYGFQAGGWAPVEPLDAVAAVLKYPTRDVFCCWPTEGADWAFEAAKALQRGRVFAVIGEGEGGEMGTDAFWRYLAHDFQKTAEVVIPQFPGVRDRLELWRKT